MEPNGSIFEANNVRINLDELADGIEDVSDPSCMDKVLEYVERIREEDDNFIELLTERVHGEEVYWDTPWYQEHTNLRLLSSLSATNNDITTFRIDTISQAEHDLIEKNWSKFRKKYKLPDQIISLARWKNKTKSRNPRQCAEEKARRFAAAYLSRRLERTISQVYQHIIAYYGGYRKGFYTETEQKIIEICFYHQPKSMASILSLVLGREPRGVYKRLNHLTNGKPEKKRIKWSLPLASKLLHHLLKCTEVPLEDLKNKQIETWVWRRLEEDMDQSSGHLQHFWYSSLHVQIFVRCDVKLHKLRRMLFRKLRAEAQDCTYKVWTDIRWKNVALDFPDGFTPRFLYRTCNRFITTLKGYLKMPLEEVVNYALQKLHQERRDKRNKRLRTLTLNEEGDLESVDYRY